ncbi:MAG: prolyl oligopeptidase family serine peptidase [Candidatus Promineifilaceae bacterium]|nr:prolyl oligopeptidase family serine peptidase [Candidatus Promineifilaceae bacterium]
MKQPDLNGNASWKRRYRAQSLLWATTANLNPDRGLVCTNLDGIFQLYAWDVPSGDLRKLTDQPTGVTGGLLAADGQYVYYLHDEGGNEIGHYWRVPFAGGERQDITPDLLPYNSFQISQSFKGNLLGTRIADSEGQKLIAFAPGATPRQVYKGQDLFFGPSLSYAGEIGVIATTEGTGSVDTRLAAIDLKQGEPLADMWDGEGTSHRLGDFAPRAGDFRLLSTTSQSGYDRPLIWNPKSGERFHLPVDDIPGEITPLLWSRDAQRVLLVQLYEACTQLYLHDLQSGTTTPCRHPEGVVGHWPGAARYTADDRILFTWQDPAHPPRLLALDGRTGEDLGPVLAAGDVPPGRPWQSVSFPSENGTEIQAWLAVPEGKGPFPTVLHTHGGPTAVMSAYYSPESQAWLDHGCAFFSINYHGSTTFGKSFEKSILGLLGELEVQDMASGYRWLVAQEIAPPDGVYLAGDSYGGYLTLHALARRPNLWAAGMAGIAIADWALLYEDQNETLRSYQRILFGGTPAEKPEAHAKSSPLTFAQDIQAPILVIQGSNDTRCPARQMKMFEERLRSLGKPIEVHWFEAGHGSLAQELQIDHQELKLRFAYQTLRGT